MLQEGTIRRVGADREREIDVRVVTATNRDLEQEINEGRFREDLYWRLNVIHLHIPPLRERPLDIPLMIDHFLNKMSERSGATPFNVTPEALAILTAYSWPGNVRELENAIESGVALAEGWVITPEDLPERIKSGGKTSAVADGRRRRARFSEQPRSAGSVRAGN